MNDNDKLRAQMHDCGECLESFLLQAVDAQPELEEHAGVIREHLDALRKELDVLCGRVQTQKWPH